MIRGPLWRDRRPSPAGRSATHRGLETRLHQATHVPSPPNDGTYNVTVNSGALYPYRVWANFPGPVLSPPSPPATVRVT